MKLRLYLFLYAKGEGGCTRIKHSFKKQHVLATTLSSEDVAGLEAGKVTVVYQDTRKMEEETRKSLKFPQTAAFS